MKKIYKNKNKKTFEKNHLLLKKINFVKKRNSALKIFLLSHDVAEKTPKIWYTWRLTSKILKLWENMWNETTCRFHKKAYLLLNRKLRNQKRAQKKMRFLRRQKKAKLSLAFFEPWKKIIPPLTRKQHFLQTLYTRYRHLRVKDRIDFFRSYTGQILLATEIQSQNNYKNTWFSMDTMYRKIWDLDNYDNLHQNYLFGKKNLSLWKTYSFFAKISKKSWWYDNLVQKKRKPKSAKNFILDRPNTAFQIHWKDAQRDPWKNALLFRRAVYSGFGEGLRKENKFQTLKIKPYLRYKNPRSEKRNLLYKRNHFLLSNFRQRSRIYAKKAARIKNIVSKIIWPFYGNLRIKQMNAIYEKTRRLKSKVLTNNEILLSRFENRLDVVVYRLNLAPTILWARRLIKNGCVFVTSPKNVVFWESMYASLKKIAFPLKLRDPKKLYSQTLWTKGKKEAEHWALFKFLGQPQKKISYLLQPGDLIQCASGNSLHQFKTKSSLWQKPLPTHLLTKTYSRFPLEWRFKKWTPKVFNSWEQTTEHLNAALFLHNPQFHDLGLGDRVKESFFRWTIL